MDPNPMESNPVIERLQDTIDRNMHEYLSNLEMWPSRALSRLRLADRAAHELGNAIGWWDEDRKLNHSIPA